MGGKLSLKEPKTERSRRVVTLSERPSRRSRFIAETMPSAASPSAFVASSSCSPLGRRAAFASRSGFRRHFRPRSGPPAPTDHFSRLRHTQITQIPRSGVPVHVVSPRAGHARPITTLNVDSDLLEEDQEKAVDHRRSLASSYKGSLGVRRQVGAIYAGRRTKHVRFQSRSVAQLG